MNCILLNQQRKLKSYLIKDYQKYTQRKNRISATTNLCLTIYFYGSDIRLKLFMEVLLIFINFSDFCFDFDFTVLQRILVYNLIKLNDFYIRTIISII